jgi:hypothetical protein
VPPVFWLLLPERMQASWVLLLKVADRSVGMIDIFYRRGIAGGLWWGYGYRPRV